MQQAVRDVRLALEERRVQLFAIDGEQQRLADACIAEQRILGFEDEPLERDGGEVDFPLPGSFPALLRDGAILKREPVGGGNLDCPCEQAREDRL